MKLILVVAKALLFASWMGASQPSQLEAARDIALACHAQGIDPLIGVSVGWQETKLCNDLTGAKGEVGLMQIYWRGYGYTVQHKSELQEQRKNAFEGCARLRAWKTSRNPKKRIHFVAHYNGGTNLDNKPAAYRYERAVMRRVLLWKRGSKKIS